MRTRPRLRSGLSLDAISVGGSLPLIAECADEKNWATSSLCCDSRSRKQYDALRAAGHLHARALRGLADRLLGVLIALLKTKKTFDRARRDGTFAKCPLVVASE